MIVNIKATQVELTATLKEYIEKKLQPLDKLITGDKDSAIVYFEVERTTNHHKKGDVYRAEIKINLKGMDFYADETNEDLFAAIDVVKGEVLRELKSYKSKKQDQEKSGGRAVKKMMKG